MMSYETWSCCLVIACVFYKLDTMNITILNIGGCVTPLLLSSISTCPPQLGKKSSEISDGIAEFDPTQACHRH